MPTATLTTDDEQAIASRIAAGDRAARDELVRRWGGLVRRFAAEFRGDQYLDAVQDGLLALVEAANGFRPGGGPFRDVAAAAIRRAVRRGWRRRARERRFVSLDGVPADLHPAAPEPAEHQDTTVATAILRLSETERRAVRRRHRLAPGADGRATNVGLAAERKLREALTNKEALKS